MIYQRLLDASPNAMIMVDSRGEIAIANRLAYELFGYGPTEIIGLGVETLIPERFRDKHAGYRREFMLKPEPRHMGAGRDLCGRRKDGTEIPIEIGLASIEFEGKTYILASIIDISERRAIEKKTQERIEEALKTADVEKKRALSLLEAALESTADGVLVVDRAGRIMRFNKQFARMWRIPDEVLGKEDDNRVLDFVLPQLKDPDGFLRRVRELYAVPAEGSHDVIEFVDERVFDRVSIPLRNGGDIVGRVWTFHDITEVKRVERDLRRQNAELEILNRVMLNREDRILALKDENRQLRVDLAAKNQPNPS